MKSIGPTTPYGYTLFCDDIRQEAGGKISLMGIYAATIEIHQPLPFTFPKFCFYINYHERHGENTEPVELRIYLPGDEEEAPTIRAIVPVEQMRAQSPPVDSSSGDQLIHIGMNLVTSPLVIKETGRIRVRAYRGDLEIRLGTIPVNAPLSSGQAIVSEDKSGTPTSPT